MAEKPNLPIDFERAANLMDVVQKVASVTPTYTALSSVAMMELKEYNNAAQEYLTEIGKQRLAEEQAAAAELAEHNRKAMEDQAKTEAEIRDRTAASRTAPPTIMPGQPVPQQVQVAAGDVPPPDEDHNMDGIADQQEGVLEGTKPVVRRV